MHKESLYQQYQFLRSDKNPDGKKSYSQALFILSMQHGKHESVIAKALEECEGMFEMVE